jgi:uncharacterized membrane-anchored protein YitT (DUF2179 family)
VWRQIKCAALVVLGTLLLSLGVSLFMLPYRLVTGGVAGYAIILTRLLPFSFVTESLVITVLTWTLFFVGWAVLGRDFALKTLISTIVYPVGVALFSHLPTSAVLGGFFDLQSSAYAGVGVLLAAVFSGALIGLGCALSFLGGGSTGGLDIIAFVLCKLVRRLRSSVVIFLLDAMAVVLGMFVIGDLVLTLLGIISAFLSALVVDKVFLGGSRAYVAHIVTEQDEAISRAIIERIDRTTTVFDVHGGYSGRPKRVLMVSFTVRQYTELTAIVSSLDRDAFMMVHRAHEIGGEGWTKHDLK